MSVCVIFNPTAGRSRARRRLRRFLAKYESRVTLRPTASPGDAMPLAQGAADEGFDVIAAAGGDGTAHDVANGILRSGASPTLAIVPIGSANDYAHALRRQFGATGLLEGEGALVDVGRVSAGDGGRSRYFVEGAGCGLAGEVTLASREIRYLQGMPLYGLAVWRALREMRDASEWELAYDGHGVERRDILMLSLLLGCREGSFSMAPEARLDDGMFNHVEVGRLGRWQALRLLPRLALFGPPASHPHITRGCCTRISIRSPEDLCVHTDGELFAKPGDGVREATFELLPGRLRVKLCEVG